MIDQSRLWDEHAAATYDTPGEGMFAAEVLEPTVALLSELAAGGRALELAIGTGRVAIPLREAGVEVAGIELSEAMIDRLREKVDAATIPVVQGDMTTATAGEGFTLAYLVFNTISNLLTQEQQVECFRNAARHLAPGGRFVVELWVPQLRSLAPGHGGTVEVSESGYLLVDTYDTLAQLVVSHHVRFDPQVDGSREAQLARTPHRYVWPAELDLMAQLAGFEFEHRYAGFDRAEFTAESRSHVSVYRRA
ncbi:class I SAM-dependent methyltransferase [Brachybacterium sp. p3-SID1565]|uniref:Class I SAM-dependent methyltransferase n=1 Tax=Brachybacterium epidermidis TaxID=2781983 RepID=A0ABR9W2W1_9MICO|nr:MULTISPECIES: class I SAM-dependent methyltransferase [Brachybacterium]MBE9404784.1 class I SAM-dependent methyltransferase [Brachybacterium epidermidis]MCT1384985.1 class I SAM-dependent methyltransferase [Brachybacterium sp. p3-SID1565]